jgi:hypothetical protein
MKKIFPLLIVAPLLALLGGCASIPDGPSVAVMPAPNKPFEVFLKEDKECRQFARQSIETTANKAAAESAGKSMAAGAALGAVAGAAMGGNQDSMNTGAAIGMLQGAMIGTNEARYSRNETQRRYDIAYEQCMYAKGNQLPRSSSYQPQSYPPPPPPR